MVSLSPRLRDSLDFEEPDATDPRLSIGFRSMSLDSSAYEGHELEDDHRPFSATPDASASRRKKRQRNSKRIVEETKPFRYSTCADGNIVRLVVLQPGVGVAPIECKLILDDSKAPRYEYTCLSYCWETTKREAAILLDGFRFPVTTNLLIALRHLRKSTTQRLIWIDQICINQYDDQERAHQVSIMEHIFNKAKEVIVWLGEHDRHSKKLCEYAKRMRRGEDSPKSILKKLLNPRQLQDAIQSLLQRPWFERVWVIPEVALGRFTVVAIGTSTLSWDNLVRLIRDSQAQLPQAAGFDKQSALLGNPRQRIAIITQMIASQRVDRAHTDITQLLIIAKGSRATDDRDKVFAFYGLTHLRTFPNYLRSVEMLYVEIAQMYINNIQWVDSYSKCHGLDEGQRNLQLMSFLYSAGSLHQHYTLPSWVPDWTFNWHLAPIWAQTKSNFVTGAEKDEWSNGIRSKYRAGGGKIKTFDILEGAYGMHQLQVSVAIFDTVVVVSDTTPASTPDTEEEASLLREIMDSPNLCYGRTHFKTARGLFGMATPGVETGDEVSIVLGADVPFVLRPCGNYDDESKAYKLLCECFVQSESVMQGKFASTQWTEAEDVVLI